MMSMPIMTIRAVMMPPLSLCGVFKLELFIFYINIIPDRKHEENVDFPRIVGRTLTMIVYKGLYVRHVKIFLDVFVVGNDAEYLLGILSKPIFYRSRKTELLSLPCFLWQESLGCLTQDVLGLTVLVFHAIRNFFRQSCYFNIKKRHAKLEGVGHGHLVRLR